MDELLITHTIHTSRSSSRDGGESLDTEVKKEEEEEKVSVNMDQGHEGEPRGVSRERDDQDDTPRTRTRSPLGEVDKASESGVSEGKSGRPRPKQGKEYPKVPSAFARSDDKKSPYIQNLMRENDGGDTSGVDEEVTYPGKGSAASRPTATAVRSATASSASDTSRPGTRRGAAGKSSGRGRTSSTQEWKVKEETTKQKKFEY